MKLKVNKFMRKVWSGYLADQLHMKEESPDLWDYIIEIDEDEIEDDINNYLYDTLPDNETTKELREIYKLIWDEIDFTYLKNCAYAVYKKDKGRQEK